MKIKERLKFQLTHNPLGVFDSFEAKFVKVMLMIGFNSLKKG